MIFEIDDLRITMIEEGDRTVLHEHAGGYEAETLEAWAYIVTPHRVALDIGAYTGLFSIVAALKGAQAIAMEPMPANRWRLECNAAANKAKVEVLAACASDEIGYALLHYNNKVPLTTGASLEEGAILHNTFMAASRVTVDSLLLTNVAAIKIDVERHEPCVLRGAMSTIERDRPSLIIETLDAEMRNRILHMLPSYTVAAILDGRNTFFAPR